MSQIEDEVVSNLAKLCRIAVTEDETKALKKDLSRMLDFIEQLDELDVEGSHLCNQVIKDSKRSLRADEVKDLLPRDVFLSNAPDHLGGMIKVPPILKKD